MIIGVLGAGLRSIAARRLANLVKDPKKYKDTMREMAREELKELEEKQPKLEEDIKLKLVPPDPLDEKNIILEIRSAAGGDEASLFVRDLWEMYTHLAERKGRLQTSTATVAVLPEIVA